MNMNGIKLVNPYLTWLVTSLLAVDKGSEVIAADNGSETADDKGSELADDNGSFPSSGLELVWIVDLLFVLLTVLFPFLDSLWS